MLYFSKLKITLIALFTLFMVMVSSSNFLDLDLDKQKKIKLGLDLQGGSYLLLELDNEPVIKQKLQSKLLEIKDYFKKNKIKILSLKLDDKLIKLKVPQNKTAIKAIGISEIKDYLHKKIEINEVIEKISIKTRQYAKRQSTWARGNMSEWNNIKSKGLKNFLKKI